MTAHTGPVLARPSLLDLPRRHPWLAASLLAHLLLAASLYTAGPVRVERRALENVRKQVAASLAQTTRRQMHAQVRTMEAIEAALEESAGLPAAPNARREEMKAADDDPARRARVLAKRIEQVRQHMRAAEMARLLKIPEAEARKRVQAEAARQPAPAAQKDRPPEAEVAQLAAQAKAALAERRAQLVAQRQGVPVKGETPGAGPQSVASGKPGPGKGSGTGAGAIVGSRSTESASTGGRLDALAKSLDMAPYAVTGSSMDMSSSAFSDARSYGAYRAPPALDAARVQPGSGRMLGAGAPYASRVFLDTWYVIGPFEGQGGASQQAVYPPERGIDLDAVYYGKSQLPVRWTWQQDAGYPTVPQPRAENAVYYAYTEVQAERDMDVWVWIGADDDSKMWFNDSVVWISSQSGDKTWYRQAFTSMSSGIAARNLSEGQRKLHFHKGRNTILFKLYNGIELMFFSVVLSASD
jgi:hypothetical protein